jgi:hypothetical protein
VGSSCDALTPSSVRAVTSWPPLVSVLYLCSVSELGRAQSEIPRIPYLQNEVQETLLSLFPIYRRLPKLDVNSFVGSLARSGNDKQDWGRPVRDMCPAPVDRSP